MHRIDTATAVTLLPSPGPVGPKPDAFFKQGTSIANGTVLDPSYLNSLQEEIVRVIINSGATLDKTDTTQLYTAIQAIIADGPIDSEPLTEDLDVLDYEMLGDPDFYINASGILTFENSALHVDGDFKLGSTDFVNEFIDEDDMTSDSSTAIPTASSVLEYIRSSNILTTVDQYVDIWGAQNGSSGLSAPATNLIFSLGLWTSDSSSGAEITAYSFKIPFDGILMGLDVTYEKYDTGIGTPSYFDFTLCINKVDTAITIHDTGFSGHVTYGGASYVSVVAGDELTIRPVIPLGNNWTFRNFQWSTRLLPLSSPP